MENKFYVYEWYNTDTKEVFYVGKGCGKRYTETAHRNQKFLDYINSHNVESRIVINNLTEEENNELEKIYVIQQEETQKMKEILKVIK